MKFFGGVLVFLGELAVCGLVGFCLAGLMCWGMSQDDDELRQGKCPHSGFAPDCPKHGNLI